MKNILVAIDFEPQAEVLIDKAIEFAEKFGAKLWLVHATAPEPSFVGYDSGPVYVRELHEVEIKKEQKLITELAKKVKKRGYDAEAKLLADASIKSIAKEASKIDADMIIVGSHKHGFLYNLWFGNTTDIIVHRSNVPILVIPLQHTSKS